MICESRDGVSGFVRLTERMLLMHKNVILIVVLKCAFRNVVLFKGLASVKSEDNISLPEDFLRINEMCWQTDQSPSDYLESPIPVMGEAIECNSRSGKPRRWVVCVGGVLKEVLVVDEPEWTVETLTDGDNIDQNVTHNDEAISKVDGTQMNVSTVDTEHSCDQEQMVAVVTPSQEENVADVTASTCDVCGKSFTMSSVSHGQETVSTGVKPSKCSTCDMSFTNDSYTECQHNSNTLLGLTSVYHHSCSTCGQSFTNSSELEVHENVHTNERVHKYSTRSTTTVISDTQQNCTGVKGPPCCQCGVSFPYRSYINLHHNYTLPV